MIRFMTTTGLMAAVVLLFAVNILSNQMLGGKRLDLTANAIYTLSHGTRNILRSLSEPVRIRLYFSHEVANQVPAIKSYGDRVKELLAEYERLADGKLTVHIIEPKPFSDEEDRAVGYGLRGVPTNNNEDVLYFGLVGTNSVNDEDVIPFLSTAREAFLEYDLTKLIFGLSQTEQATVGLLSTLPIAGFPNPLMPQQRPAQPWVAIEQLQQLFEVIPVPTHVTSVPDAIDVLLVVHPKGLADKTLYAIDQFVMGGGRLMAFVDPNAEAEPLRASGGMMIPVMERASSLERLFSAWGFEVAANKVVGDLSTAVKVAMDKAGRRVTFDYPVWLQLGPSHLQADDPVTSQLGNLAFGTPGYIQKDRDSAIEMAPLVQTTKNAALFDVALAAVQADPEALLKEYIAGDEERVLAARLRGRLASAFPDGPPSKDETDATNQDAAGDGASADPESSGHLTESTGEANLLVVADTDVLSDRFWVQIQSLGRERIAIPVADNGSFLVNAVENMMGSTDLISVRSRGTFIRPFDRVNVLRREAEQQFREKEAELLQRLELAETKLVALEEQKQGRESVFLSAAQENELVEFRQERLRVRKDLREVRRQLRQNIESLEDTLKFVNIGLVPLLIGGGGLLLVGWRALRRRHSHAAAVASVSGGR